MYDFYYRQLLTDVFDHVYLTSEFCSYDDIALSLMGRPELGATFTKLHCWRLTQFQKCVYLDADTLVGYIKIILISYGTLPLFLVVIHDSLLFYIKLRFLKIVMNFSRERSYPLSRILDGRTVSIAAFSFFNLRWKLMPNWSAWLQLKAALMVRIGLKKSLTKIMKSL